MSENFNNENATNTGTLNKKGRPRPLSPHLQVYKPEFTSMTSIAHRGSGIFNYIGLFVLVYFLAAFAFWPEDDCFGKAWANPIWRIMFFFWTVSIYYHLSNGIRHLFWDFGFGYEIKKAARSAVAVLVSTIVLTTITWFLILSA